MIFRRILIVPLLAAALFFGTGSLYAMPVLHAEHSAHAAAKTPAAYHYICPMHEDVKSKTPGKCPKCKMKLEKKKIKEPVAKPPEQ